VRRGWLEGWGLGDWVGFFCCCTRRDDFNAAAACAWIIPALLDSVSSYYCISGLSDSVWMLVGDDH
jgi:hypothetical protein